jgi:hypothetical protein
MASTWNWKYRVGRKKGWLTLMAAGKKHDISEESCGHGQIER